MNITLLANEQPVPVADNISFEVGHQAGLVLLRIILQPYCFVIELPTDAANALADALRRNSRFQQSIDTISIDNAPSLGQMVQLTLEPRDTLLQFDIAWGPCALHTLLNGSATLVLANALEHTAQEEPRQSAIACISSMDLGASVVR